MEEENIPIIPEGLTQVCEDHNEGLEYIYNGLLEADDLSDPEEIISVLANEFFNMKYPNQSSTTINSFHSGYNKVQEYFEDHALAKIAEDSAANSENSYYLSVLETYADSLSEQQIVLLEEIYNISLVTDFNVALTDLNNIINQKVPTLPESERLIVLSTAEMAKSSFSYWNENLDDWYELFDSEGSLAKTTVVPFNWGAVGSTDAIVFVGGIATWGVAAAGAAITGVGLPVAGTIVIGICEASIGSSAAAAIAQIFTK